MKEMDELVENVASLMKREEELKKTLKEVIRQHKMKTHLIADYDAFITHKGLEDEFKEMREEAELERDFSGYGN